MNLFSSATKGGNFDVNPGPAFTKDEKGRPKLTDAFASELRESVRALHTTKTIKRKRFGFFGLRRTGHVNTVESSSDPPSEKATRTPSSRRRQLKVDTDDMNTGFTTSPLQLRANDTNLAPSTSAVKSPAKELKSPKRAVGGTPSSDRARTLKMTIEEADELRKSFHDEMVRQDGHKVRPSRLDTTLKTRPTLNKELAEELRMSFRKRHGTKMQMEGPADDKSMNKNETTTIRQRPSLSKEMTDELYLSFRQRKGQQGQADLDNNTTVIHQRPSLNKGLADELRQSFAHRKSQKLEKRRDIASRIMTRRESKRALLLSEHDASEHREDSQPAFPIESSKRKVNKLRAAMNDSGHSVASFASGPMDGIVENDPLDPRDTSPKVQGRPSSWKSLQKQLDETKTKRNSLDRRVSRHKKTVKENLRDMPHMKMSFHEDSPVTRKWSREESELESNPVYAPFAQPTGEQWVRGLNELNQASSSVFEDDINEEVQGDFDMYKKEWARLIKEKRSLKNKLSTSRAHASLLSQQVDDFTAENMELRKHVNSWQEKATKLGKLQNKERVKFDNSTDLIAQARVELTRTLNETSKMKAQIYDLESVVNTKIQRIEDLHDTIERQTEMIEDLTTKYRDKETELRFSEDEKRKLEDEVAVLISSRDGDDIGDTLRELEKEREQWLWQREQALEEKRRELEAENDQILEREKQRHRQEMEKISKESNRAKTLEQEQQTLQESINQQLKDMKDANQELQAKLTRERLDSSSEIKKQDHSIALLEQEVLNLKKELASRDRSEKEIKFRKAEVESTKDDVKDAQKQNKLLEKEIENLKLHVEDLREQSHGWREIILPGYRNMRGVTFGATNSDSLAGFLTILVEEQGKKAKMGAKDAKLENYLDNDETKTKHRRRSKELKKKETIKSSKIKAEKKQAKRLSTEKDKKTTKKERKSRVKARKKEHRSKSRGGTKVHGSKPRKPKHIVIDNDLSSDQNLTLIKGRSSEKSRRRRGVSTTLDDSSMAVFKRDHNASKQSEIKRSRSSDRQGRISSRGRSRSRSQRRRSFSHPPISSIILQ